MNTQEFPIIYYSLAIFFSGLAACAVIQFAFTYFKMPRRETLAPFILSCIALFYILGDVLASFFTVIIPHKNAAEFFMLFRELVPLLFLLVAPYYLSRIFELKSKIKKINRFFFIGGVAAALAIATAAVVYPDLLTADWQLVPGADSGGVHAQNRGLLLLIRNIALVVFLIYSIFVILMPEMRRKSGFTVKYLLMGLVVISFLAFYYFYSVLFIRQENGGLYSIFPHLGLAVTIFIVFMAFGVIELFMNTHVRLMKATRDLKSELYFDLGLGIQNRVGFRQALKAALEKSAEMEEGFSLVFFDVDDFSNINESYGESVGDEVLKMLSRRMVDIFSEAGVLYRIGGDDFSLLLKNVRTEEEARGVASKIISSLRNPFIVKEGFYTLTVSIAVLLIPRDGKDMESIMNNAYSTMSIAKKTKNTYAFFDNDLMEGASSKIRTVDLLRDSISRDEFVLFYQPIVDASEKLVYAEALLRCTSSDPGIGGPGQFIPLIEKAGLMKEIDNLVVRRAFYDMEMKIKNKFSISINLSAGQLADPEYGAFLSGFAKQHGIDPQRLILEITENTLVENLALAHKNMTELKKNGFVIAIDDFGKGFSSLSYLTELPADVLKIDMIFVHAVTRDVKKQMLAKSIVDLGHSLNLKVVAEGFELAEQVDFFKGLGCGLFQGYYFSRPMLLEDLLKKYSFA